MPHTYQSSILSLQHTLTEPPYPKFNYPVALLEHNEMDAILPALLTINNMYRLEDASQWDKAVVSAGLFLH